MYMRPLIVCHKRGGKKDNKALLLFGCEITDSHVRAQGRACILPLRAGTILRCDDPPLLLRVDQKIHDGQNLFEELTLPIQGAADA